MYKGFDLSGKVAVLTGSTAGMGFAIARGLAQCGAKVVVSSNTQEDTDDAAHRLASEGFDVKGIRCDITCRGDIAQFGERVKRAFGRADILFCLAAPPAPIGPTIELGDAREGSIYSFATFALLRKITHRYDRRPLDAAVFASEPSPNASVTQKDRTRAVIALVEDARRQTGAPIVLVGHSFGGLTVTAVAETIPEQLHAAVYLCAYMLPPGMPTITMRQDPSMNGSLVPALIKANPKEVGAMRIDPRSEDSDYREQLRLAFASDLSPTDFAIDLTHKHCDEPVQPFLTPSVMTAERFGRVPRHYFRTLEDRVIPIAAQDFMISAVDIAMGNLTHAHTLATSHAPHLSQPDAVAEALLAIASGQV
jgi:pimeloyl-ACP methyl ester carboxylesterase